MARKALIEKNNREPKFAVRHRNRCSLCGRARGYMRFFKTCRLCFRKYASQGLIAGVRKASW
jgi:small subunit ribosomal protein S14